MQKYRLYLSRIQKQNDAKDFIGNKQHDHSLEDHTKSLGIQSPRTFHQNCESNSHGLKSQNFQGPNMIQDFQESELNKPNLFPAKKKNKGVIEAVHSNAPQPEPVLHFKGMLLHSDLKQISPSISNQKGGHECVLLRKFMKYPKHDDEPVSLSEDYSHPTASQESQVVLWQLQCPSLVSINSSNESDEIDSDVKPSIANRKSHRMKILSTVAYADESVSIQLDHTNSKEFGVRYEHNKLIGSKEHRYEQSRVHDLIPPSINLNTKNEANLNSLPEDLNLHSLQGFGYLENVGFNGMELHQLNGCGSLTELQSNWYDEIEFNCDYWYDPLDYPLLDECLFA